MAVYQNNNPGLQIVGKLSTDATTITSGYTTGIVEYQILRRDGSEERMMFSSDTGYNRNNLNTPQVISISASELVVILPLRTKFKYRVRRNFSAWGSWVKFNTKDKRYQSPDAITKLTDDTEKTAAKRGKIRITVTNNAKATVTQNGRRVVNVDNFSSSVASIQNTSSGATVDNRNNDNADGGSSGLNAADNYIS